MLLMSSAVMVLASLPPLRGVGIPSGPTVFPSNDRNRDRRGLLRNARVGLCLHEHNVQVVTVTMWCRWMGFCSLRISTTSDAMIASCFGKFRKPKTAPQVRFCLQSVHGKKWPGEALKTRRSHHAATGGRMLFADPAVVALATRQPHCDLPRRSVG